MKSKTTGTWFLIAALLFAFTWFFQKHLQPHAPAAVTLVPGLHAADVTAIQVSPAGAQEISVIRTNDLWLLQKPVVYPAQATAIQALSSAIEKLAVTRISAADMQNHQNAEAEYGFENPQFTLAIGTGERRQQLIIGNKTAPGDQVFVRRVGEAGAFVVDSAWLQLLPHTAAAWRDTALVDAAGACDWIVITNGSKVMEFRLNPTNQMWRMIRPLAARADGARLAASLQQLRASRVTGFITDDPRADLSNYGLQPAELSIWLGRGTNFTTGVEAGKNLPDKSTQIYVRREGWDSVLAAAKDDFAPWRGAVNDFRDTQLLDPLPPVSEIEVHGEKSFTLQQTGSNAWAVAGEKFPADPGNVQNFLKLLSSLRISEFVKDVVTAADLESFGLAAPSRQIILRSQTGDTNRVVADLMFGMADTNRVIVKRGDENFIYAITPNEFNNLFLFNEGWYYRDRRIWDLSETNIVQVTMRQNGKTRQIVRTGEGKWSFAAGSQGIISPKDVDETMHRLGNLTAAAWVGYDIVSPEKYGLNPENLSLTVELKNGDKLNLDFGAEIQKGQTALAAVTLDGKRWVFIMEPTMFQFVATFLTIPPDAP